MVDGRGDLERQSIKKVDLVPRGASRCRSVERFQRSGDERTRCVDLVRGRNVAYGITSRPTLQYTHPLDSGPIRQREKEVIARGRCTEGIASQGLELRVDECGWRMETVYDGCRVRIR